MKTETRECEGRLIEDCRRGDRDAFRELFELYKDRVWSIAFHYCGDEALARDITQQVFLKLFTTIGQFRNEAVFSTWLYRLVVNACIDEQRKRRRFVSFDFFGTGRDEDEGGRELIDLEFKQEGAQEAGYTQKEVSRTIAAAIRELKPKLRMAILLKYFEEMSYDEIAQTLDCSPGTVASRLNRGHKELARKLGHLRGAFQSEER